MKTGKELVALAEKHKGDKYVFGALPKNSNPNYRGPWDCAAFVTYELYQLTGKLYGTDNNNKKNVDEADAYTGFWKQDFLAGVFKEIPIAEAKVIPGAILLRYPGPGLIGHIAITTGRGNQTIEAHDTASGVINSTVDGRRWDKAFLIPDVSYDQTGNPAQYVNPVVYRIGADNPVDKVKKIQKAVGAIADGIYGKRTAELVSRFQESKGLVADGEYGAQTDKALGLNLIK